MGGAVVTISSIVTRERSSGGGISTRNYQMLQADFSLPYLADRIASNSACTPLYRHNPQEDFWGVGPTRRKTIGSAISSTTPITRDALSCARYRGSKPARASGGSQGQSAVAPTSAFLRSRILFTDATAPGLSELSQTSALPTSSRLSTTATRRAIARDGGYYSLTVARYPDLDLEHYDFRRIDLHLAAVLPDLRQEAGLRGAGPRPHLAQRRRQQCPFLLPADARRQHDRCAASRISGSATRTSCYLNVEYRWEAFSGLDMALFYRLGKVATKPGDLGFSDLKHAYGIGLRFNTYKAVFLRIDIGVGGGEGLQLFLQVQQGVLSADAHRFSFAAAATLGIVLGVACVDRASAPSFYPRRSDSRATRRRRTPRR